MNIFDVNKNRKFQQMHKNIMKNQMEIIELRKYNNNKKSLVDELNSRMKRSFNDRSIEITQYEQQREHGGKWT